MSTPQDPIIASEDDAELSLMDVLTALGEEKLTLFLVPFFVCVVTIVYSLTLPSIYTARTVILPAQASGGSSAALAGLSGLAGLAGLSGISGAMKSSDEMYIALMRSQSVQDSLINKLALKERYRSESMYGARVDLNKNLAFLSDKKAGLITIDAQDTDPQFAAKLANQQVEELNILLSRLAVTQAQQKRLFYEQQIQKTQISLAAVETRFRQAQEKSGMQMTSVLAESNLRAGADIRGQVVSREIQLQALSQFATAQNPEVQRISSELAALRSQLGKYEQGSGHSSATPLQQEAAQAYRDLKAQEALLNSFVGQLEIAKVDESKEGPAVQVVDVALPPENRSKPARTKLVLSAALVGALLGIMLALVKNYWGKTKNSTKTNSRLHTLKRAWAWRQ